MHINNYETCHQRSRFLITSNLKYTIVCIYIHGGRNLVKNTTVTRMKKADTIADSRDPALGHARPSSLAYWMHGGGDKLLSKTIISQAERSNCP